MDSGGTRCLVSLQFVRHSVLAIVLILTATLVYTKAIFLQNAATSPRISSLSSVAHPPLFPEFDHPNPCYGLYHKDAKFPIRDCAEALKRKVTRSGDVDSGYEMTGNEAEWVPSYYTHNIMLIVDALRFTWLAWNASNTEPPYNGFATPHLLLRDPVSRHHSQLYRAVADIPTMTTQRLRGLMVGDIPPFFDISKSVSGSVSKLDDSLPLQLQRAQQPFISLGDDTWARLFSGQLNQTLIDMGLNIHDYDTVDDGIHNRLWKLLMMRDHNDADNLKFTDDTVFSEVPPNQRQLRPDWSWIVAHTLGSDHIGHDRTPQHPLQLYRYQLYDDILATILFFVTAGRIGGDRAATMLANTPDIQHWTRPLGSLKDTRNLTPGNPISHAPTSPWDDTVVFMFGDHGMTDSGAHGGANKEEVEAGLWIYSPRPLLPREVFYNSTVMRSSLSTEALSELTHPPEPWDTDGGVYGRDDWTLEHGYDFRSVEQTDLTVTWALLLGLPVPSNAIGNVIPEMFPLFTRTATTHASAAKTKQLQTVGAGSSSQIRALLCDNKRLVGWTPSLDDPTYKDKECEWAFGSAVRLQQEVLTDVSSLVEANEGTYVISRVAWLRHLRYLVTLQHLRVWQLYVRIQEVALARPDLLNDDKLITLWHRVLEQTEAYAARQRHRDPKIVVWNRIMAAIDRSEGGEEGRRTGGSAAEAAFLPPPPAASWPNVMEEIDSLEGMWSLYRDFGSRAQRQLRIILSANQRPYEALCLALIPMIATTVLFGIRNIVGVWQGSQQVLYEVPGYRRAIGGLVVLAAAYGFASGHIEALLLWALGVMLYCCLCIQTIETFGSLWVNWNRGKVRDASAITSCAAGLLVQEDEGWTHVRKLMTFAHSADKLGMVLDVIGEYSHWFFVGTYFVLQCGHGAAIMYPGLVTRYLFQCVVVLIGIRGTTRIWSNANAIESKCRRALTKATGKLWIAISLILIGLRVADVFDIHYISPRTETPIPPLKINSSDLATGLLAFLTVLLLYSILGARRIPELLETFQRQKDRLAVNTDVQHFLRHILGAENESPPVLSPSPRGGGQADSRGEVSPVQDISSPSFNAATTSAATAMTSPNAEVPAAAGSSRRQRKRRLSDPGPIRAGSANFAVFHSPAPLGPVSPTSPDLCCPSGKIDLTTSSPWPLIGGSSRSSDLSLAVPTDKGLERSRQIAAVICVAQALLATIYMSACAQITAETDDPSAALVWDTAPIIRLLARIVGIPRRLVENRSYNQVLRLLLPRAAFMLCMFHLSHTHTFAVKRRGNSGRVMSLAPMIMGSAFYFFLFLLQDVPQAISLCIQAAALAPFDFIGTRVITDGFSHSGKIVRNVASNGQYLQQLINRLDQTRARRTVRAYDMAMRRPPSDYLNPPRKSASSPSSSENIIQTTTTTFVVHDEELLTAAFFLMMHLFWSTGHRADFRALPLSAAFVGLTKFGKVVSVLLVILHCITAPALLPIIIVHWVNLRSTAEFLLFLMITVNASTVYRERYNLPVSVGARSLAALFRIYTTGLAGFCAEIPYRLGRRLHGHKLYLFNYATCEATVTSLPPQADHLAATEFLVIKPFLSNGISEKLA